MSAKNTAELRMELNDVHAAFARHSSLETVGFKAKLCEYSDALLMPGCQLQSILSASAAARLNACCMTLCICKFRSCVIASLLKS